MSKSPKFYLKDRSKSSVPTLISMVFWISGKRIVISTGVSIALDYWNDVKMRAKTSPDARSINDYLNRFQEIAQKVERDFRSSGEIPTSMQFKEELKRQLQGKAKPSEKSFKAFIETFIKERAISPYFTESSVKVYKTFQNHYTRFTRGLSVEFKDVTMSHMGKFVQYLNNLGLGDNTVHKMLSTMRTILYEGSKRGIRINDKISLKDLKVVRRASDSIYLTLEELSTLNQVDLSANKRLERVRDLFLIGAYTGLRYSDFTTISTQAIRVFEGKEILSIITKKTKEKVVIPVTPILSTILNKRDDNTTKRISNQKFNLYLKELCKSVGMNELIKITEFRNGKTLETLLPKWDLVTSHTARRSFITNACIAEVNERAIMKITGHKSTTVFTNYVRIDKEENALRLSEHPFFN